MDGVRGLNHEIKYLKYQLKQAHKLLGKQGETIYQLRNEVAALRAKNRGLKDMVDEANTLALDWQSRYYDSKAPDVGFDKLMDALDVPPSAIEGLA